MIAHARRTEGVDTTNRWVEIRRSLPGDRMIRIAATSRRPSGGLIVGCLYLPNGNPAPGPKFDYKLRLFERLTGYSKSFGQRRVGSDLAIAVGTPITGRPPHRSVRAAFLHTAPTSDV